MTRAPGDLNPLNFAVGCVCLTAVLLSLIFWGVSWSHRDQDHRAKVKIACIAQRGTVTNGGCVIR